MADPHYGGPKSLEPDVIWQRMQLEPEPYSVIVMAAALLCWLMMCMKLCNLRINCSVVMSVIWFALLFHIVMHICLFEWQLMLTNDLELSRFLPRCM